MILAGDYIAKKKSVSCHVAGTGQQILANLESPVCTNSLLKAALKAGPNLSSASLGMECGEFIFNLANNHMMDYGEDGLRQTCAHLEERGIRYVGAGMNRTAARQPIIVSESGKRIGIIGCREAQFGSVQIDSAGCADMGLWVFDAVRALKTSCDYVIVSCHAALEHSPFPSPRLRDFYRHLIEAGADVIHGHHAHIPQGWESYRGGVIFYGLGNFVVDPVAWKKRNFLWSNVVELAFGDAGIVWKVKPVEVDPNADGIVVREPIPENADYYTRYMEIANGALADDVTLEGYWQEVCSRLFDQLYGMPLHCPGFGEHHLTCRNRARYALDAVADAWTAVRGRKRVTACTRVRAATFYKCFLCESHVDAITTACGLGLGNVRDCRTPKMVVDCDFMRVEDL